MGTDHTAPGLVLSMALIGMAIGAIALGMFAAARSDDVTMPSLYRLVTGCGIGGTPVATNVAVAELANAKWWVIAAWSTCAQAG